MIPIWWWPPTRERRHSPTPRHIRRSESQPGSELSRTQAPVRAAALELAGLQQVAYLARRWRLSAQRQGDHAEPRGSGAARLIAGAGDPATGDRRDPAPRR